MRGKNSYHEKAGAAGLCMYSKGRSELDVAGACGSIG